MKYARRWLIAMCLIVAHTLHCGAIEVEIRAWSPISMVVNDVMMMSLDDEGLIVRVEHLLNRNSVRHADRTRPLDLEPWKSTTVERVGDSVVQMILDHHERTRTTRVYHFERDQISWESDPPARVEFEEQPGRYRVYFDEQLVADSRVWARSLEIYYPRSSISFSYSWRAESPMLTIVRTHPQARWEAHGTYDAANDTLTIFHPIEDDPSPFEAKFEILNAGALLRQRYTAAVATLNSWIVDAGHLRYLYPLFTVGGLME